MNPSAPHIRWFSALFTAFALLAAIPAESIAQTFKIVQWNIQSAKGMNDIDRDDPTLTRTDTCEKNAWGGTGGSATGLVPTTFRNYVRNDPAVVAVVLNEAWRCGSPSNVRAVLGGTWKVIDVEGTGTGEMAGVSILARYGFADENSVTPHELAPGSGRYILHKVICLDASPGCPNTLDVYATHWGGASRARESVAYMAAHANRAPHVMIGDLNQTTNLATPACGGYANASPGALAPLRDAGYVDVWERVNPDQPGRTGMLNRRGCGNPEGFAFARIDYAWAYRLTPVGAVLFPAENPHNDSPSDHRAVKFEFRRGGSSEPIDPPAVDEPPAEPITPVAQDDIVWANMENTVATGTAIEKVDGCGSCLDAHGSSVQALTGPGAIEFTVPLNDTRLFAGLSAARPSAGDHTIDYAITFWPDGTLDIREASVYRVDAGTFTPSDVFRVAVDATGVVTYYKNDEVLYVSQVPAAYPLHFRTSLLTMGSQVANARIAQP